MRLVGRREGVPAARLEGGWGGAAHVLSMVSILRVCWFLGIWNSGFERPCLAGVLLLLMGEEPGLKPIVAG